MQENAEIEKHVFQEADLLFEDKLHSFHDKFVDCFLLTGVDESDKPLDKVKMTKNPKFSLLYYQRIVGGIMENNPIVSIKSISDKNLKAHCQIYYLNNDTDIEDFFYTQNVYNWQGTQKTCFQVWKLKFISILNMNNHWL